MDNGDKINIRKIQNGFIIRRNGEEYFINDEKELTQLVGMITTQSNIGWTFAQLMEGLRKYQKNGVYMPPKEVIKQMEG